MPYSRLLLSTAFGVTAGLALLVPGSAALAEGVTVPMDEVRVVTFASPVKTVFVGNPTIADITVIDTTHVFVLGKAFGTTNLIALDARGHQTADQRVTVLNRTENVVTLQRGTARLTLNCMTERCEAAPVPGDDNATFDNVSGQIDKKQSQNLKSAAN